jgi:hypothetical protein
VAEWFKAAVLKTVELERVPGVRIPPSPPFHSFYLAISGFWNLSLIPVPIRKRVGRMEVSAFGWHAIILPLGVLLLLVAGVLLAFGTWKIVQLIRAIS